MERLKEIRSWPEVDNIAAPWGLTFLSRRRTEGLPFKEEFKLHLRRNLDGI